MSVAGVHMVRINYKSVAAVLNDLIGAQGGSIGTS